VIRLLNVLNTLLEGNDYFAGDEYSIAHFIGLRGAFFHWEKMAFIHPIGEMLELAADKSTKHANLIAWYERIGQREAVQRGLLIPEANPPSADGDIC
jgi:glutathione S-transferase